MILLIFLQTESAFDFKPLAKALFIKRNKKKRKNLLAKVCWCLSGRLAEKALQITRKLPQLVGTWLQSAFVEKRDAANAMPKAVNRGRNAGTEGQNAIWRGQNASLCFSISTTLFCAFQYLLGRTAIFRDEQPICSTVLGRTTASWDQRRFWASASNDRQPAEKAPQITRKLPQLVGKWVRPAFDKKRDAANAMPKAVNRGRNAGTEGQNAIWRGQNASLCFSLSTTLFCAFQYLLGRTAIFRDEQPICSTVLGRTTASWDQRRFWASASNDRQPAEKEPQNARKLPQLVGPWLQSAFDERRDATSAMPKAVNRGRNAGTEGRNTIWRGQNASLCFSLSTTLFCAFQYLLGRTAIFRDEQPICSTVLGRTTASWDQRRFWASASNDRQPAEKAPQITRKLPQLVGKWVRLACVQWRDATKGVPNAVNRGRNACTEGRNTIWKGRNASLCFSLSTTLFCAFQYLLGRTAIFRDKLRICSSVLGRTTVSRDELRFWASASNDKRLAEKAPQITGKLAQLVGKWVRPAFDERRDATKGVPNAVNGGRNAGAEGRNAFNGERNAKKIWRNAKKFRRNASALTQGAIPSRDRFFDLLCKWVSRTLKPYTIYLTALNVLFCVCLAHARQSSSPEAAHGVALSTDSIKPLKIGDSIPEALWNLPLQMVKVGKEGSTTVKLSDYRGKLIILDFWATWCGNCLAAIPKVEDVQEQFQQVLQVLPLTYENAATALPTMQRNKWKLPSIIKGEIFKKYFPHRFIPHYVWIKDGYVYAVTASEELTAKNIQKALHSTAPVLKEKRDLARNPFIPIDRYAAEQGAKIWKRSALTGFIEGTGGSGHHIKADTQVFYQFNRPIVDIYRAALACDYNRILIETIDSAKVLNRVFKKENLYAYQLLLPRQADGQSIQQYAVHDLNTAFGLHGHWKSIKRAVCAIKETGNGKGLAEKDGMPLNRLLRQLNYAPQWHPELPIFLSECAPDKQISLPEPVSVLKKDIHKLKDALAANGLILVLQQREIPMFILSDNRN